MASNSAAKLPEEESKELSCLPEFQFQLPPVVNGSLSSISCGTFREEDARSTADCEDHRGSISPLDYMARAQDPASLNPSPRPAGPVWHYRYSRQPAGLAGSCLLSSVGLVTVASVIFLVFMSIRYDKKLYKLLGRLVAAVFGPIFRSD